MMSWWRTSFGEETIDRVAKAIRNECISLGPVTKEFEDRMAKALGVPYVVATTSGSVAILMALMAIGIKKGDEVIVPNRTWIATAHAPLLLGAKVVVVDVLSDAPIMDVSQLKKKITSKTKAIIPVPLNGRAVDMSAIWALAKKHKIHVIEDAAQGLLSKYKGSYMGTQSSAGCFSLSTAKLVATGQGGFVVTKNKKIYENLKRIRMHGVDDVIDCTFYQMGFNFRFTDVLAAIGIVQLERAPKRIEHLRKIYARYTEGLKNIPGVQLMPVDVSAGEVPIYIEVLCKNRASIMKLLASHQIQTRPFYPCLNKAKHLGVSGKFPNAEKFERQGLVLPSGPEQSFDNVDRVIGILQSLKKGTR